jgi:hypothetical protein
MLILNDQLKNHLDNWDDDSSSVIDDDEDGSSDMTTSQIENNASACDGLSAERDNEPQGPIRQQRLVHRRSLHYLESTGCGFVLGIWYCKKESAVASFISLSKILLLLVVVSTMWLLLRHWRESRTYQREEAMQARRLMLAVVLGRIGGTLGNKEHHNVSSEMLAVATAFERLLQTMHDAMERLQCAASMQLGLGIWSPSVHRVEQAASARGRSIQAVAGSSKTVLAKALLRSLTLLGQEEEDCPAVVTLAWLKSTRQKLIEAFSEYVWLEEVGDAAPPAAQLISRIHEIAVHVQAYYGRGDPTTSTQQEQSQEKSYPSTIEQVAMQLHAAQVALWSYCHQGQDEGDESGSEQDEWINRFDMLLKAANTMQDTLNATHTLDQANKIDDGMASTSTIQSTSAPHPSSFEHEGQIGAVSSARLLSDSKATRQPVDKTLVFSGKGSVQLKRQRSKPAPQSVPISITRMTQAMLFQELQTRLSTLDTADEINVNMEEEEYAVMEEIKPKDQKDLSKTSSSSMFGMSVSLLSELQVSIGTTTVAQQDDLAENYGD